MLHLMTCSCLQRFIIWVVSHFLMIHILETYVLTDVNSTAHFHHRKF